MSRGLTLVECLVGVTVASVLMGAACGVLVVGQRSAIALAAALDIRHNAAAAEAVLRGEVRLLARGELVRFTDSSVVIRALRGVGTACAVDVARALVTLHDSSFSSLRAIDPLRDSVRVLAEGDEEQLADDRWLQAGISTTRAGGCPTGEPGIELAVAGLTASELATVTAGATARLVEIVEYRHYIDAAGERWFGVRSPSGAAWSAMSPIAGPLEPVDGLRLIARDAGGALAGTPDSVRLVDVAVRLRGARVHGWSGIRNVRDSALFATSSGGQ